MAATIKKNFAYHLTLTLSGLLFSLITFPYASRILLADGIGQVEYFNSIITYITLFTCIGIPLYAVRETARVRSDRKELSRVTFELMLLLGGLAVLGYVAVGIICLVVADVAANIPLFLLLSISIAANAIGVEWFYQGTEDFKYITLRGLAVKVIALVWLLAFVRERADLIPYAGYLVVSTFGGNIFNFVRLRRFVSLRELRLRELRPLRHLKPALRIFALNLTISIYAGLDTVMLGAITGEASVGYYVAATKATRILLGVAMSLGSVMLPRLSHLVERGEMEQFRELAQKGVNFVLALCFPLTAGLLAAAPVIIHLLSGYSYEPSIMTLRLLSPIIVIISLSNIIGMQILYPQGKENLVIISTAVGAAVNFSLNLILIPHYAQYGAAFATTVAEVCVTTTQLIIGARYIPIKIFSRGFIDVFAGALIAGAVCYGLIGIIPWGNIASLAVCGAVCPAVYIGFLLLRKYPLAGEVLVMVKSKIKGKG